MNELRRLTEWVQNQPPAPPALLVTVEGIQEPTRCLASAAALMQAVLTIPTPFWNEENAPHWAALLPDWFVASMRQYTVHQILAMPEQWHFESWVAAMRAREWEWWSSASGSDWFQINATLLGLPHNIEPLLYILHACCGSGYRRTVTESG